ncbi:hypothetical protein D5086_031853 [Populus alba]|uniref:Uncharacterized protein n=1 Tax=Populus alba TaxID=43335 RepID=A0ACC4AJS2_POPAL
MQQQHQLARPEVAAALLLVRYCLLGGGSASASSGTGTTRGDVGGMGVVNLTRLRVEVSIRASPSTAASADIGSNPDIP